jgi:hypothetical protein
VLFPLVRCYVVGESKCTPERSASARSRRLDRAFRTSLTISKTELLKEEAKEKFQRQKKRDKKPS